jgi:hypothetical protein
MDGDIFPNVIDYWGRPGMVFVRTPQIRLTFYDTDGLTAAVAFEHPSDDIDQARSACVTRSSPTACARRGVARPHRRGRYGGDWGHVRLAGIARSVGYDTLGTAGNEPKGDEFGWGLNLTSAIKAGSPPSGWAWSTAKASPPT